MFTVLQFIPAMSPREIQYETDDGESWAPVVGYVLTDTHGILPVIGWGENGETDILDPETGSALLQGQDYNVEINRGA